jgi:hypothetical protein
MPEKNHLKGTSIYFDSVSEIPVHGHLNFLLLGCVKAEYHGRNMWWRKPDQIMATRKQNARTIWCQSSSISFKGTPLVT